MINRKNLVFCIIAIILVIGLGSAAGWQIIKNANDGENDKVSSIETQSSDDNMIAAMQTEESNEDNTNQTSEDNDSTVTTEDNIVKQCAKYIKDIMGYDDEGCTGYANYVEISGVAESESFWSAKIDLKDGHSYGFNLNDVGGTPIITDVFSLQKGSNNQKIVLTSEMQDYMDNFEKTIDEYFAQDNWTDDLDNDSEDEEDKGYDYYYHIIYNGTDNDLSYQKVELSGLAEYLGITEDNAKQSYTQKELETLLDEKEETYEVEQETIDMSDFDGEDIWELSDEMTQKINEYVNERSKQFVNNSEYKAYEEKALELFSKAYDTDENTTATAYLDIIVNGQNGIIVRINNNNQYYCMVLSEDDMEVLRISKTNDIVNGTEQTQVYN